jgi:hypothetical protein
MANTKIPSELSSTPSISDSGDATAITITSGEAVGIGTTSPTTAKVVIAHDNSTIGLHTTGGYNYQAKFESTDAEAGIVLADSNSTGNNNRIGVITNDLVFTANNSERLRIDGTGSKMITTQGTTRDSNWGSDFQGFQMANTHVAGYANTVLFLGGNNVWSDANYFRSQTGYSSQLVVNDSTGSMVFKGWGTGSAGQLNSPDIRFKVTNEGIVTAPNHPVFDVSTTATGGLTGVITYNTVYVNVGSHYSTSNGRFTAPVAGTYMFSTMFIRNANGNVARRRFIKNGSTSAIHNRHFRSDSVGSYGDNGALIVIVTLAANDYVQVDHYAGNSHGGTAYEQFSGYLIG